MSQKSVDKEAQDGVAEQLAEVIARQESIMSHLIFLHILDLPFASMSLDERSSKSDEVDDFAGVDAFDGSGAVDSSTIVPSLGVPTLVDASVSVTSQLAMIVEQLDVVQAQLDLLMRVCPPRELSLSAGVFEETERVLAEADTLLAQYANGASSISPQDTASDGVSLVVPGVDEVLLSELDLDIGALLSQSLFAKTSGGGFGASLATNGAAVVGDQDEDAEASDSSSLADDINWGSSLPDSFKRLQEFI